MLDLELGFEMCHTDGCPISKYEKDGDYYVFTITFPKYPGIYIETGRKKNGYFTYISQVAMEDNQITEDKVLNTFDKEMLDLTQERLRIILTFG